MTWSSCHDLSWNSKAQMHISGSNGNTAHKVKLDGSRSNTSSLLCPRWMRDPSRPNASSRSMDGNEKRRMKSGRLLLPENSSSERTLSSGIHSSCASSPSRNLLTLMQDTRTWKSGAPFFWGKDIADRKPQPSEMVLLYAERNAWRDIHNRVYEGAALKDAMTVQKADALFWQREVYERLSKPDKGSSQPKGSGGRDPHGHRFRLSGPKANKTRRVSRPRGPRRGRTTTGPRIRQHRPKGTAIPQGFPFQEQMPGKLW